MLLLSCAPVQLLHDVSKHAHILELWLSRTMQYHMTETYAPVKLPDSAHLRPEQMLWQLLEFKTMNASIGTWTCWLWYLWYLHDMLFSELFQSLIARARQVIFECYHAAIIALHLEHRKPLAAPLIWVCLCYVMDLCGALHMHKQSMLAQCTVQLLCPLQLR